MAFVGAIALTQVGATPVALAVGGTFELTPSASIVDQGEEVTLAGVLSAGGACAPGRTILLEWRPADSTAFATVAQGSAADDGTFSFQQSQRYTGRFRVTAPAEGTCEAVVSDTALVRVRVRVDSTLVAGSLTAGSCVDVTATVTPVKPGQTVDLQRRSGGGWTTIETLTLNDSSSASARPCFGWEDVGVVRLRVRWPAQDEVNETDLGPTLPFQIQLAAWMQRIEDLVGGRSMSVSVGEAGEFLYGHAPAAPRTPASNEKLLLSMTLLDTVGPDLRIATRAASAKGAVEGVLQGDLWILGRGDPEVDAGTMAALARRVAASGISSIRGRVMGSTTYFLRDWDAPGWNSVARDYVARPTALTFEGNQDGGRDVADPEARAAAELTRQLERIGVTVKGRPGSGRPPGDLADVASVRSRTLRAILVKLLRPSNNFYAEVLGKRLGVETSGTPGTIAKGARAIESWVDGHGTDFSLFDSSGLSYDNRVSAEGIVRLLWVAEAATWGQDLFDVLPSGGQGTLRHRLSNVQVKAKTGTLTDISALSGWVWLEHTETWAEFSILSSGMGKTTASDLEDRIVRLVQNRAR